MDNNNILNNHNELELAKIALDIALKNGANQARVTLNMGIQYIVVIHCYSLLNY